MEMILVLICAVLAVFYIIPLNDYVFDWWKREWEKRHPAKNRE